MIETHDRTNVWKMFNRIASRYDLLNRLLSLRQDVRWRKKLKKYLPSKENLELLDIATGTADVIISLIRKNAPLQNAVGVDMAEKMLDIGRKKLVGLKLNEKVILKTGDAIDLPFPDESFDVTTISFGIRNVTDIDLALQNMHRVLKNEGRSLILEFSLPDNSLLKKFYLFYFRKILPKVGGLISGDSLAYRYLNETVETFPSKALSKSFNFSISFLTTKIGSDWPQISSPFL